MPAKVTLAFKPLAGFQEIVAPSVNACGREAYVAVLTLVALIAPALITSVVTVPVKVGEANGALSPKPGTVGVAAVPPRSPANCIFPFVELSASAMVPEATCKST